MKCKNCSAEIDDNAKTCPKCGAAQTSDASNYNNDFDEVYKKLKKAGSSMVSGMTNFKAKNLLYAIIGLFILTALTSLSNIFVANSLFASQAFGYPFIIKLASESYFIVFIAIVVYIFALAALLLPFSKNTVLKPSNLLPANLVSGLLVLITLIILIFVGSEVTGQGSSLSLSFAGWLMLISGLLQIILSFKLKNELTINASDYQKKEYDYSKDIPGNAEKKEESTSVSEKED